MTNKPLIVLGVVIALAMAGGHAKAAECPATDLASILSPTFSCTIGDRTFEDFMLDHVPMGATVSFAEVDDNEVTVTLSRGAAGTLPNGLAFDYTLAITSGTNMFTEGTLGNDVTQRQVTTTTAMTGPNGSLLGMATSVNGAHEVVFEGVRVPFVEVTNISTVSAGSTGVRPGRLNGLSNDFFEGHPAGAPEPMSLSLFGLGLAGLALARRRRT